MFRTMLEKKPKIVPNIRTINTLLRGCIISGDALRAEMLEKKVREELKVSVL